MKRCIRNSLAWILIMGTAIGAVKLGAFNRLDGVLSDLWYQKRQASSEKIVLVGIDERALEDIGPFQTWGREIMAMVIEALNSKENCRPAVIGVDVVFTGETDPEADEWLAEAAGQYGNVVTAGAAQFGSELITNAAGEFYMDQFSVLDYDAPFDALRQNTTEGHINAMLDTDGVLRHCLLYITLPDGMRIPSFSYSVAEMYQVYKGETIMEDPPVDSRGFWYVPYTGRPGDLYENISVTDVLNGDVPPEYFADKIVLIGPYAAGFMDSYMTAADHAVSMYGVEYQANAILALLNKEYKHEAGDTAQLLLLCAVLLFCTIWFWNRKITAATVMWAAMTGGWLVICRILYSRGLVLHVSWIPVCITILYMGTVAVNYARSAMERRRVTLAFKKYVAPEIVNEILKQGSDALELGGKVCKIAVLFVDIRGFTTMSEVLEPTQVVDILNRYLTLTSDCIMRHRGTLDKFVGDCTMAFWNAPLPQEDYVMLAAKAAWDMAEGSRELSEELLSRFGRTVSFGIGIHVGQAVVGNIGAANRMDYTAIGDTVNTASRLESNAPGGTIYISRAVADVLEGRINATSLGETIRLKGKSAGFEILTLDGIRGCSS